jgi:hypothetical protein
MLHKYQKFICLLILSIPVKVLMVNCRVVYIIEDPNANIISTVEGESSHNTKKSEVCKMPPKRIENMGVYRGTDFTKRFLVGIDMDYGIFYDLKVKKDPAIYICTITIMRTRLMG